MELGRELLLGWHRNNREIGSGVCMQPTVPQLGQGLASTGVVWCDCELRRKWLEYQHQLCSVLFFLFLALIKFRIMHESLPSASTTATTRMDSTWHLSFVEPRGWQSNPAWPPLFDACSGPAIPAIASKSAFGPARAHCPCMLWCGVVWCDALCYAVCSALLLERSKSPCLWQVCA